MSVLLTVNTDSLEVLCLIAAELLCHPTSNLPDRRSAPHQKYISGWVLGLAR